MVDYAKKTVAELQEILKTRSLPHSGKKAELIARLNQADQEAEENGMYSQVCALPTVLIHVVRTALGWGCARQNLPLTECL